MEQMLLIRTFSNIRFGRLDDPFNHLRLGDVVGVAKGNHGKPPKANAPKADCPRNIVGAAIMQLLKGCALKRQGWWRGHPQAHSYIYLSWQRFQTNTRSLNQIGLRYRDL
jgi:hypothetical protein